MPTERSFEQRLHEYGSVIDRRLDAGPSHGRGAGPSVRSRGHAVPAVRLLVTACVLAIVGTLAVAALDEAGDDKPIASTGAFVVRLDGVPEGVSLRRLGDEPVFLRRSGR
jgi:hypothetical protein